MTITLQDIYWLRLAARKTGTDVIPANAAKVLAAAHLITAHENAGWMKITSRGELALRRLAD